MYIISKCNNICLTTNTKKISVLDLFMQIYLTNTNFRIQISPPKNRSDESLTSILHVRSTIMFTNNAQYHQLVFVHIKTDASPIFIVSRINAKFLALIQRAENRLSVDFLVLEHQQVVCLPILWQNTRLPAKYGS